MEFGVLGPLFARGEDGPIALGGAKARAVLAVLLVHLGHVVSLDQLADFVWDGDPPERAQAALYAYVSRLRAVLEPGARGSAARLLVTRPPGYALDAERDDIDAHRFEQACAAGRAELVQGSFDAGLRVIDDALSLWRGDPYAEFQFARFARGEIARLVEMRWAALEDRSEALLGLGRHVEAAASLDGLVVAAPLRERLRAHLALALYRSGRQADALRCLDGGRRALAEELGIEPSPSLRALERQLLDQDPALDYSRRADRSRAPTLAHELRDPTDVSRMVGRAAELRAALDALHRATTGAGSFLLVTGEPGIGKTLLAEQAGEAAAAAGIAVHWARCSELDGVPPFWTWVQVLRSLVARGPRTPAGEDEQALRMLLSKHTLDHSLRIASPGDADAARFGIYDVVSRTLLAACSETPTLVVIDDVQWADVASLRLLRFLATHLADASLAVIATLRDGQESNALDELRGDVARSGALVRIDLRPLERNEVERMIASMVDGPPDPATVDAVLERSGGNPFYVSELVRADALREPIVPVGVRDVVDARVGRLAPSVRDVLRSASCISGDVSANLLADVLGRPALSLLDDFEAAAGAQIVVAVDGRAGWFRFAHPLAREAVYNGVSPMRRAYLHDEIARALERIDDPDDEIVAALASHLRAAVPVGRGTEAMRWTAEVGRRAMERAAFDEARAAFDAAIAVGREEENVARETLLDVLIGSGTARRYCGDPDAREPLDEAMVLAARAGDAGRLARAALATALDGWTLFTRFGVVDGVVVDALEKAIPRLDGSDGDLRSAALARLACEYVFAQDAGAASRLAHESVELARAHGSPQSLAYALTAQWLALWSPTSWRERATMLSELDALASDHDLDLARPLLMQFASRLELADGDGVTETRKRTAVLAASGRNPALATLSLWQHSLVAILGGDFVAGEAHLERAFEQTHAANPRWAIDAYSGQLALLRWEQGRMIELVPALTAIIDEQPYLFTAFGSVLALALATGGRSDDARGILQRLGEAHDTAPTAMMRSGTVASFAAACVELADVDLARIALRYVGADPDAAPGITDEMGVFYVGARDGHAGALHLVLGDVDEAVAALARGILVDERVGAAVFARKNRVALASALLARGRPGDSARAAAISDEVRLAEGNA